MTDVPRTFADCVHRHENCWTMHDVGKFGPMDYTLPHYHPVNADYSMCLSKKRGMFSYCYTVRKAGQCPENFRA